MTERRGTEGRGARGVSRRDAIRLLGGAVAGLPFAAGGGGRAVSPNVLVIMTDDQQQRAMSAYGNRVLRTPNMDRIAAGGVRFTEAFTTNSLCGPSRASVLTGLYSHAHGYTTNADGPQFRNSPGLRRDQPTFVHSLRSGGYHTGLVGKWHIKGDPDGFDQWVIFPWQGDYHDPAMIANGVPLKLRGHADDVVGDQALAFLDRRPKDRPFCLLYQFKSPHRSWQPAARFARAFEGVEIPIPAAFDDRVAGRVRALAGAENTLADMPDYRDSVPASLPPDERRRRNLQQMARNYYRVLLSVDENVGRVLDYLERERLAENTIVVYTSDNGFFLGEHGLYDKRLMYEPSIRVPFLVRYPARVPAGRVDGEHMVLNVDVLPTLLELCGAPVPASVHGRSLVPLLTAGGGAGSVTPWREDFLYEYFEYPAGHCVRKNRGVRTRQHKLIHFFEQPEEYELYDLAADPNETRNLAGRPEMAATHRRLVARLGELRRELGDTDPPGPPPATAGCRGGERVDPVAGGRQGGA